MSSELVCIIDSNFILLLRGGGVPEGGGGSDTHSRAKYCFSKRCVPYHPTRWAPLLPGGEELRYSC